MKLFFEVTIETPGDSDPAVIERDIRRAIREYVEDDVTLVCEVEHTDTEYGENDS